MFSFVLFVPSNRLLLKVSTPLCRRHLVVRDHRLYVYGCLPCSGSAWQGVVADGAVSRDARWAYGVILASDARGERLFTVYDGSVIDRQYFWNSLNTTRISFISLHRTSGN